MRIVIVGGGEIAYALARELSHDIFVIDHNPDVRETVRVARREFLTGSATSAEVLQSARVSGADLLIGCTGLDEVNLVACAIANGVAMWIGRLEVLTVLTLLRPDVWRMARFRQTA